MSKDKKMKMFNKDSNQINGLLDKGCSFEGKLTFDGVVQINGDFQGDILSDGTLVVGRDARVKANIVVDTLIIDGYIEGVAEAKTRAEIHDSAQFVGEIITPRLSVEEGAVLQGTSRMKPEEHHTHKSAKGSDDEIFVKTSDDPMVM